MFLSTLLSLVANASGTQEAVHNVDNVLYALPSTTSKEMPQVNGSNKKGNFQFPIHGRTCR